MSGNTTYCSGNATENGHQFTVTSGLYIALGVLGNLAAIVVLVKQSRFHNWKVFYRLALSLVCVDLIGILMFGSISVKENSTSKWLGGDSLCMAESVVIIFISLTNLLTVTTISLERFLALWHPYFYSSLKNHPIIKLTPVAILSVAVVMAILPAISIGHFERIYPCDFCFIDIYDSELKNFIYALLYSILGLICITTSIVLNVLVVIALSRGQRGYSRQRESRIYISYDRRDFCGMMFQLLALIAELSVCWGPVMIKSVITMLTKENDEETQRGNYLFFRFAAWALVLDPWLYVILRREIISSVCAFCQRREHPHLTSSEDKMEEKSLQNNQHRTSYGTI